MRVRSPTTIAILGGNTVAGLALSFLLGDIGYETIILKAPPTGPEELLRDVNLLLVAPGLRKEQRDASLAILRGTEEGLRVPVFAFGPAVEESVFAEDAGSSWPVAIGNLARAIEAALGGEPEIGPAVSANPVGEVALQ
jgi:hypothetical protein